MFVTKLFLSFLFLIPLISSESVFSKTGKRYTYEYNVDLQVNPNVNDVKKIGYNIYFDVYPKNVREYVVHITQAKPYHGDDIVTSSSIQELKSPFLVKRVKSRNSNKYSDYKITFTNPKESIWSQNLKKSLVSLFEVDYRPQEVTYDVKQETLSGTCDYHYVLDRRPQKDIQGVFTTLVTRVKDPNLPCYREKPHSYFYSDKVPQCFQKTDLHNTHDYVYTIDELAADNIVIKDVEATEKIRLVYGFHHEITYPIVSKQKLHLVTEEGFQPEQSSNQIIKDLFEDKNKGEHLQTTLEGIYQPYYGHDQIEDKYLVEKITELAPKVKGIQSGQDTDFKKFLHYGNIVFRFMNANYDEIKRLYDLQYNGVDPVIKSQIFFMLLGQVPHYDGIKFVLENSKELIDGAPTPQMKEPHVETLIRFLHSTKFHFQNFTNENGEHFINFCKNDFIKHDRNLNKVCWLAFSRIINSHCTKSNPTCSLEKADYFQEQTLVALNIDYKDQTKLQRLHNEILMLVIKVVKNFNLQSGLPVLRAILLDRTIHHGIRKEAAWVYYLYDKFDKTTTSTLLNVVNDRKEDYDLRLGLFFALVKTDSRALIPFVVRLKNSFVFKTFEDDQQLIHGVHDLLYYSSIQNKTICNRHINEGANMLYKLIGEEYRKYFGFKDLTESFEYNQNSNLYRKIIFMTYVSSKGLIPEGVFFSYGDSFNVQEFFLGKHMINKYMKLFADDKYKPQVNALFNDFIKTLGIKKADDHKIDSYTLSYTINKYDVFFIYSDENSPANTKDFSVFFGSPMKNLFFIDYGSYTDSGFPYYFHAKQSRFVRLFVDTTKYNIHLPLSTYGVISSTVYLPMTDYYLVKGRTYTKYIKEHVQFGLKKFKFDVNEDYELDVDMTYKQSDHYEKVNKYHFVESFKSLPHFYFIDGPSEEFSPETHHHEMNTTITGYTYEIRAPYEQYEDLHKYSDYLHFLWLPTDTLLNNHYLQPYFNHYYKNNLPKTYGLKFYTKNLEYGSDQYYFGLYREGERLFETTINIKYDDVERKRVVTLVTKNYAYNYNTLYTIDTVFPKMVNHEIDIKKALNNIQNATFVGKIYFTHNMDVDPKSEENLYTEVHGLIYKKTTPDRVLEYQKEYNHCLNYLKSMKCLDRLWLHVYRYDSVLYNVKLVKPLPLESPLRFYNEYLNYFNVDLAKFNPFERLEGKNEIKLYFSTLLRHGKPNLHTFDIYSNYGHFYVRELPMNSFYYVLNVLQYYIPYSTYYLQKQMNTFPRRFFDYGYCLIKPDHIETFDQREICLKDKLTYDKPIIVTHDYIHNDVVITLTNKHTLNVIYYRGLNLTVNMLDKVFYIDGKSEELNLNGDQVYKYSNFVMTFTKYNSLRMLHVYFANGVYLGYENGNVHVRVPPKYIGSLTGVCGDYDHNWTNDLKNRHGEDVQVVNYVQSWQY